MTKSLLRTKHRQERGKLSFTLQQVAAIVYIPGMTDRGAEPSDKQLCLGSMLLFAAVYNSMTKPFPPNSAVCHTSPSFPVLPNVQDKEPGFPLCGTEAKAHSTAGNATAGAATTILLLGMSAGLRAQVWCRDPEHYCCHLPAHMPCELPKA